MKTRNGYKIGVAKRKLKMGREDFEAGALITKMNAQKVAQGKEKTELTPTKAVIMGAI